MEKCHISLLQLLMDAQIWPASINIIGPGRAQTNQFDFPEKSRYKARTRTEVLRKQTPLGAFFGVSMCVCETRCLHRETLRKNCMQLKKNNPCSLQNMSKILGSALLPNRSASIHIYFDLVPWITSLSHLSCTILCSHWHCGLWWFGTACFELGVQFWNSWRYIHSRAVRPLIRGEWKEFCQLQKKWQNWLRNCFFFRLVKRTQKGRCSHKKMNIKKTMPTLLCSYEEGVHSQNPHRNEAVSILSIDF